MNFIIKKIYDLHKYQYLLDGIWKQTNLERYNYGSEDFSFSINENKISLEIYDFLKENNLLDKNIILSLSGGVDSMVIFSILLAIKRIEEKFNFYIVNINYNLRKESLDESEFIRELCNYYNISYLIKHVGNFNFVNGKRKIDGLAKKRKEFEDISSNVRFDAYKELIEKYGCSGVILGHHKDDITENIFTNTMKGHDILDLEVMKKVGIRKEVNIYRPLLDLHKSEIYNFSEKYKIPYFLDTTPEWSRRGKMRNEIFPLLDIVFNIGWRKKLKEIGEQSNMWKKTIDKVIVEPWFSEVHFLDYGFVLPIKHTDDENLWTYFIPKLFFKIGYSTIRKNTIKTLLSNIKNNIKKKNLDSGFEYQVRNNHLIIYDSKKLDFKDSEINNIISRS